MQNRTSGILPIKKRGRDTTTSTSRLHRSRDLRSLSANHRCRFYSLQRRESEPTPTKKPMVKPCNQNLVGHEPNVEAMKCETPVNPPSDYDSDSSAASEYSSDAIMSELSDPFRDSPTSPASGMQDSVMAQDVYITFGPENLPLRLPMMDQAPPHSSRLRLMLSARIQRAVNDAVADAESRIARLVDIGELLQRVDEQHRELERRMMAKVEGMLLARDMEIGRLRKELDGLRWYRAA